MKEEKIEVSLNEEDVQNLVNCYEKDIKYIKQLETNWKELKKFLQERKFVYNITGEDLEEDTTITEILIKMCEIESGKNER